MWDWLCRQMAFRHSSNDFERIHPQKRDPGHDLTGRVFNILLHTSKMSKADLNLHKQRFATELALAK